MRPRVNSKETTAKMSAAGILRFSDPAARLALSLKNKGQYNSPETRANKSKSAKLAWAKRKGLL